MKQVLISIFAAGALCSCDVAGGESFALGDWCDAVFDCYGFTNAADCESEWLATPGTGTTTTGTAAPQCGNESAYLSCVEPCAANECGQTLDDCELACFNDHCGEALR